jgi:FkbM family methyltransferase
MTLPRKLRVLLKSPLTALTEMGFLRRRILFDLKLRHYDELNLCVPLGLGLTCPISREDFWHSFSEIFVNGEYAPAFDIMPLPNRWIDLGCHAGFFSLFVAWLRAKHGMPPDFSALLVDADSRTKAAVERLADLNNFEKNISFIHGVISSETGAHEFVERASMSSSLYSLDASAGSIKKVEALPASRLLEILPPPYDLIKVDVEGAEHHLLSAYAPLLKQTSYLLLEWHSWHCGGGGREQIAGLATSQAFELKAEVVPPHDVEIYGRQGQCGLSLYKRVANV